VAPTSYRDDYKYVPVRRLALYIEESLFRGTKWVVFEPNDEPLWAQIRLNVGAFMHNLFRRAPSRDTSPKDAYFVKCDAETTTQNDYQPRRREHRGRVRAAQAAEFVFIKLHRSPARSTSEETTMAQFSVNPQRFDPYKNFKFRVKWDGRVRRRREQDRRPETLDRSGEAPRRRRSEQHPQVAGPNGVRCDQRGARRHARSRVRAVGEQGVELRLGAGRRSLTEGFSQGHHHRGVQ
jgi:hypothetical protein